MNPQSQERAGGDMTTHTNTANGSEVASDHQKSIPLNQDGTVNYFGYFKEEKQEHWTEKFN
jgi:hypothetical protein